MTRAHGIATVSLFVALGCNTAGVADDASARAVVTRVAAALGLGNEGAIRLSGRVRSARGQGRLVHEFAGGGRFRTRREQGFVTTTGHDGTRTWKVGAGGIPRVLAFGSAETARCEAWILNGAWSDPDLRPFDIRVDDGRSDDERVALELIGPGGRWRARLFVDRATWLPLEVEREREGGLERLRFLEWGVVAGRRVPRRFERTSPSGRSSFVADELVALALAGDAFEVPTERPDDTRFTGAMAAQVEVRRLAGGRLGVRASLDGVPGWFLLDTGTERNLLRGELADELGWEALGTVTVAGAGGRVGARLRRGGRLELGGVRIEGLPWVELELDELERQLGGRIDGVLGFDLFARCIVAVDWNAGRVELFDPARRSRRDGGWEPLAFDDSAACLRGAFPHREGWFRLDTGSDDTVLFHGPAARKLGVAAGLEGTASYVVRGVGGDAYGRRGRLRWFELGGRRFERPLVTVVDAGGGLLEDPYLTGTIGVGLLTGSRTVFDYASGRVLLEAERPAR